MLGSDGVWDKFDNTEIVELTKSVFEERGENSDWYALSSETILLEAMSRGSTDNISVMMIGLNDPTTLKEPKKGNEHIKILSSINSGGKKKMNLSNKENSYPEKIK